MSLKGDRIIVVGDMHGKWNRADNHYLDRSRPDLVLFVGDLGSGTLKNELSVITQLARLAVAGLVLPGNNDAAFLAELKAELSHQAGVVDLLRAIGKTSRAGLSASGYSVHELSTAQGGVSLICARPCSMGGRELAFAEQVQRNYDVATMEESRQRLLSLVDACAAKDVVFMAHNGPFGLGAAPEDLFGRDFSFPDAREQTEPRDWGDQDLKDAIDYAKSSGKRVLGVLAGHMHRRKRTEGRPLAKTVDDTVYVNTAVVPRIVTEGSEELHHFVEVELRPGLSTPEERFLVREQWVALD